MQRSVLEIFILLNMQPLLKFRLMQQVSCQFEPPAAAQMYKQSSVCAAGAHWDGEDMK